MSRQPITDRISPDQLSDRQIVRQVLAGDTQAFECIIKRHEQMVARIVAGKVPGQEIAEVAHLVFIRAFQSLPNYKPIAPFAHWLSTLAVRTCYDFWRKCGRNRETPLTALSQAQRHWLKAHSSSWDAGGELEAENLLEWALSHLSAGDRMALTLVHLEGSSVSEAADMLGWSKANVKVRCFRARKKLRSIINRELSGDKGDHDEI